MGDTRCERCRYYICVCHDARNESQIPPVNHVEALSSRMLRRTSGNPSSDLTHEKTLRRGEWSEEVLVVSEALKRPLCLKKNIHTKSSVHFIQDELEVLCGLSKRSPFIHSLFYFYSEQENSPKTTNLVFEYIRGGEVVKMIQEQGLLEVGTIKLYTLQLYSALQCVHSNYYIHRDVKPSNLLLTDKGNIKLTGFSLAKKVHDRCFTLCGTAQYVAPEMLRRDGYAASVDWWSFGIVLFELAFGHTPFEKDTERTAKDILQAVERFQVIEKPAWCPDARLWDIISKLLVTDVASRCSFAKGLPKHTFYRYLNTKRLEYDKIETCAVEMPYIPKLLSPTDTSGYFTTRGPEHSNCSS